MVINLLRFLKNELIYNGHLQSLGASGVVASSYFIYTGSFNWLVIFLMYLLMELIYVFDRFVDLENDKKTNSERVRHLNTYKDCIKFILLGLVFLIIFLLYLAFNLYLSVFVLIVVVFGIFYPVVFKDITKVIPLFKNYYVSAVYSLAVFLPLFDNANCEISKLGYLAVLVFVEMLICQIALDIKDIDFDIQDGLKTLGVLYGKDITLKIITFFSVILVLGMSILAFVLGNAYLFIYGIYSFLYNFKSTQLITENKREGYLLVASKFFVWFCFMLVINILLKW